ncbi:MAG: restriction endonuclease, partial [Chloroflexi bacterium]|nr:restriction endonuclease [Chloroflexota bacterium]
MYDFKMLSSQDFEELTRDLLQKEWKVRLEAFKTGRDSGIDLRYSTIESQTETVIVQCKHYAVSGYDSLYRQLRTEELPKVKALSPERYVLVTSVGLTPGNKS